MLQAHVASQKPQKKKGNHPQFNGETNDDLQLWLFSTEQYYSNCDEEMHADSSEFVNTIFANMGPTAQTWYRDFKILLGEQPATWALFKQRIRECFREADYQHKLLTRIHNLRCSGSQQAYTTKFLHLLSQLDCELPEVVKRWYYQQNLRAETNAFVSQNVPTTLKQVIKLAERFEDSRAAQVGSNGKKDNNHNVKSQGKNANLKNSAALAKSQPNSTNAAGKKAEKPICE
ncbi:hypothetical protein ON010_g12755 [Phytophthora cinnamomi]|nr:hypothetical protein ON010_g12755 [Phytophthora cinnamomi]